MLACLGTGELSAQVRAKEDTVFFLAHKKGLLGKLGKSVSVHNPDPLEAAVKNESVFAPFRGKIIRYLHVEKIGFAKSVNDTVKQTKSFFADIGDALHTSTREKIILNNLFFIAGDTLYPDLLADNERFLRELTYLQDARIMVTQAGNDSVDVTVICKDVFPIGGSMDAGSARNVSFEVNDDNLFGTGNRLQLQNFFDVDRKPRYGFGLEFLKRNFRGSFLNLALGYRNQAPAYNSGRREENALYFQGELPLVSPYHSWTGAFEMASHRTRNTYLPDSLYNSDFKYNYRLFDGWIGHNVGARKQLQQNFRSRFRRVISVRAIHRVFAAVPDLYKGTYNIGYSDLTSILGAFTIFEQDYYHTNFLYGFGRNEDVPEGFSLSVIGGWSKRSNVSRPYLGFDYQRNYFSNEKDYLNYTIKLGMYYNDDRIEDVSFLTGLEYFTKLQKMGRGRWWFRHFLSGSITQLVNTTQNEPLRLSSDYGIPQLNNPELKASTRLTLNGESVFYNTWKFVGFSFAPFVFGNVTYLKPLGRYLETGDIYTAIGGGVRTRNENLVFGTMELKAFYYPRTTGTMNQWSIGFNTDLRFRYISQLIKKPDFVVVN